MEVNSTLFLANKMAILAHGSGQMYHKLGVDDQYNIYSSLEISALISRIDDFERDDLVIITGG